MLLYTTLYVVQVEHNEYIYMQKVIYLKEYKQRLVDLEKALEKKKSFIDEEVVSVEQKNSIESVFASVVRDEEKYFKDKSKLLRFIKENIKLGKDIQRLSGVAIDIAKKNYQTDEDLKRFDLVQNKTIKKLMKNYFYTLGLQKEIYILKAGVAADSSTRGQLGFHHDFLRSVLNFNNKFLSALTKQLSLISARA